jgi:acyl-CoA thioester hydrolase
MRVPYADTDQGGIVHHAAYLRWLEAARIEMLRVRGVNYRDLEVEHGYALPVAKVDVRYQRPATFDDEVEVTCWVGWVGKASIRVDYEVHRSHDAARLVQASTTLACVRTPDMRISSLPDNLRQACR